MPSDFPTSIDSGANWNTLVNNVDTISAGHINDPRDAVIAIETLLGAGSRRRTAYSPTLTFETTAPTSVTYTGNNTGQYIQMNSIIWFAAQIEISAISGGSGLALFSLPTSTAALAYTVVGVVRAENWTTLFPVSGRTYGAASNRFYVASYAAATGFTNLTNTHTGSPSAGSPLRLTVSGFYFI